MSVKFPEDVVPLTDLKVNPGRVVKHVAEAHRPVVLTSRGRGSPSCSPWSITASIVGDPDRLTWQ